MTELAAVNPVQSPAAANAGPAAALLPLPGACSMEYALMCGLWQALSASNKWFLLQDAAALLGHVLTTDQLVMLAALDFDRIKPLGQSALYTAFWKMFFTDDLI